MPRRTTRSGNRPTQFTEPQSPREIETVILEEEETEEIAPTTENPTPTPPQFTPEQTTKAINDGIAEANKTLAALMAQLTRTTHVAKLPVSSQEGKFVYVPSSSLVIPVTRPQRKKKSLLSQKRLLQKHKNPLHEKKQYSAEERQSSEEEEEENEETSKNEKQEEVLQEKDTS